MGRRVFHRAVAGGRVMDKLGVGIVDGRHAGRLYLPGGLLRGGFYQNERENLGIHSGDDSEYLILPLFA